MSDQQVVTNLAKNITRLRGKRSQYWLAKKANTYPTTIARIENAETTPGIGILYRIAEALEVTVDALICGPKK